MGRWREKNESTREKATTTGAFLFYWFTRDDLCSPALSCCRDHSWLGKVVLPSVQWCRKGGEGMELDNKISTIHRGTPSRLIYRGIAVGREGSANNALL